MLEYAPGVTLNTLLRRNKRRGSQQSMQAVGTRARQQFSAALSEDTVRPIFTQLARAIAYVHARGVVHRDVKLDNVILVPVRDIVSSMVKPIGEGKPRHRRPNMARLVSQRGGRHQVAKTTKRQRQAAATEEEKCRTCREILTMVPTGSANVKVR